MNKRSRGEEDDDEYKGQVEGKKQLNYSPTSINVLETAKLSDTEYRALRNDKLQTISEYIFEVHGTVCPKFEDIYYEEVSVMLDSEICQVVSKNIKGIDKLIRFVENKCKKYRFVVSILHIWFSNMIDITNDEMSELKEWRTKGYYLSAFYQTKRPLKINDGVNFLPHSNAILIDRELKQVERFEPHGTDTIMESENMDKLFNENFNKIGYKYFSPKTFCPIKSVQSIHAMAKNPLYRDLGYCTVWSLWYIDTRLLNPLKTRDETIEMIIEMFKSSDEKFIHETIHFYWTNLVRYIELRNDNNSPKEAIEIIYRKSISQLGEKLLGGKRAITKYTKKSENKNILSRLFGYIQKTHYK